MTLHCRTNAVLCGHKAYLCGINQQTLGVLDLLNVKTRVNNTVPGTHTAGRCRGRRDNTYNPVRPTFRGITI